MVINAEREREEKAIICNVNDNEMRTGQVLEKSDYRDQTKKLM